MVVEFIGNEDVYLRWLTEHPGGFVINTRRNMPSDYMVLHRASCRKISSYNRMAQPGGFTSRAYIKICGDSINELSQWVSTNGRLDGSFSKECSKCRPI